MCLVGGCVFSELYGGTSMFLESGVNECYVKRKGINVIVHVM